MAVIRFHQVSKKYSLRQASYRTLREALGGFFKKPFTKRSDSKTRITEKKDLWALNNVSFELQRGEALGIIGANGAGKSTILKLLAKITLPNTGEVTVHGRVGALIEIGAGFHPELSGRENIYLNGVILGMKIKEINSKFKEIVDFAELWDFIDVPIKKYSSGMRVRLGFAVAAHVDVGILLVDEVLAVGDLSFQRKCLDKIKELREKGTTIVYVSHQLDTVIGLCDRAIYLDEGEIIAEGEPNEVVRIYQNRVLERFQNEETEPTTLFRSRPLRKPEFVVGTEGGTGEVEILRVRFLDEKGSEKECFTSDERMIIRVEFFAKKRIKSPVYSFSIIRLDGLFCCGSKTKYDDLTINSIEGPGCYEIEIGRVQLSGGLYIFSTSIYDEMINVPYAFRRRESFKVEASSPVHFYGGYSLDNIPVYTPIIKWRMA